MKQNLKEDTKYSHVYNFGVYDTHFISNEKMCYY